MGRMALLNTVGGCGSSPSPGPHPTSLAGTMTKPTENEYCMLASYGTNEDQYTLFNAPPTFFYHSIQRSSLPPIRSIFKPPNPSYSCRSGRGTYINKQLLGFLSFEYLLVKLTMASPVLSLLSIKDYRAVYITAHLSLQS